MSMTTLTTNLNILAGLLQYPGTGFNDRLAQGAGLAPGFAAAISPLSPDEREELYTGTFDVTPACVLYVSIHLFGEENFKRGEFMASLQSRYQEAGFNTDGELPDHLSTLLRYAAQAGETERRELAEYCLLGPVSKMMAALNPAHPYRALLETVLVTLQAAYPGMQPAMSPIDQMRKHGAECATVSAGCGCGPMAIQDGSDDDSAAVVSHPETLPSKP
jgi:nitrate reductase delta subunit